MNKAYPTVVKPLLALLAVFVTACTGTPDGVTVVSGFDLNRYLGTWYEIARLDHPFERGLSNITATYSLRDDGGVKVINRGYNVEDQEWDEADGKAYFVGDENVGQLKVSFFGPFYGGYNIIELDRENYQYALVCGPSKKYLWVLARTKQLDESVLKQLVARAKSYGFKTDELIFVDQGG